MAQGAKHMAASDTFVPGPAGVRDQVLRKMDRRKLISYGIPAVILAYMVYIFFAFDFIGLSERARMDNARILVGDMYSHKVHVTRDNRAGAVSVSIEGERNLTYGPGQVPAWANVSPDATTAAVDLGRGYSVAVLADGADYTVPGYGVISARIVDGKIVTTLPPGPNPDWISASDTRLDVTTAAGRLSVTRARTEVLRYFGGWPVFFFDMKSAYWGKSWSQLFFGPQIDPAKSNLSGMVHDFWFNSHWHHKDVAWAMFETILMAFLGTIMAALLAFPLAILSARNFTPVWPLRFGMRRVMDFLRGVDALIWTIILSRAFGPGPLTGTLAILISDVGSFGKIFSEAMENIDNKQVEGIRSTGANRWQRYRFGVLPQLMPVILSNVLYFLESNTRSATVIGAIVGGGIGLLLTQAIQTQKDWEDVTYYIILIVLMVILMDGLSSWLRRKLIKGE
jgi:phosphonate transport system permease protein